MSTQLGEILYTDSQEMLLQSSAVALHYYNCCIDGSTSRGNYGYPPHIGKLQVIWPFILAGREEEMEPRTETARTNKKFREEQITYFPFMACIIRDLKSYVLGGAWICVPSPGQ
jgi:hypothetical protein